MATFLFSAKTLKETLIILTRVSLICCSISLRKVVSTISSSHDLLTIDFIINIMSLADIGSNLYSIIGIGFAFILGSYFGYSFSWSLIALILLIKKSVNLFASSLSLSKSGRWFIEHLPIML